MKTLIAFAGGALLAGMVAFFAMRGNSPTEVAQEVAKVQQAPPAAEVTPVPEPVAAPTPMAPPAPTPAPTAAPLSQRVRQQATRAPVAVAPQPTPTPVPSPVAVVAPPVAPAAPVEPPVAAASAEPPKPVFTPMKPKEPPKPPEPNTVTIAGGTTIAVRLAQGLDSSKVEERQSFQASLDQPLVVDGFVIAERGAAVEGRVVSTVQAGRVKGLSHLSIELTRLTSSDGQRVPIRTAAWEKDGEKDTRGDATKVAVGAGIGAALGAIFGGGKGAATGAGAGGAAGAGTVLATRGKAVVLPAEMRISFRLREPVTIIERR